MLHGHIFVAHGLGLVLRAYQHLIQIVADIQLAAATAPYLRKLLNQPLRLIPELLPGDVHLRHQFQNQTVLQIQQAVKQMLLLHLLVSVLVSQFLTVLHGLYGFLSKFIDIHSTSPFRNIKVTISLVLSVL